MNLANGQLGLAIYRDSSTSTLTYALSATGTISTVGLPADIGMTVNAAVQINTTGSAVNQTIVTPGGTVNLALAGSSTLRVFSGTASFTFGSFATLSGSCSFSSVNTGVQTKLFIGLANVTGTANDGSTAASLTGGSLGLVVYWNNVTGLTPGYALSATGTVSESSARGPSRFTR